MRKYFKLVGLDESFKLLNKYQLLIQTNNIHNSHEQKYTQRSFDTLYKIRIEMEMNEIATGDDDPFFHMSDEKRLKGSSIDDGASRCFYLWSLANA